MSREYPLPLLPLILWRTPPGLEMILAQEGVPFVSIQDPTLHEVNAGRFVLADARAASAPDAAWISRRHVVVDPATIARGLPSNCWDALVDHRSARMSWSVAGRMLVERVARTPRAELRRELLANLRGIVEGHGGLWARLAAFPPPYRSAFNLRVDLDEDHPDDYAAFARARRPIEGCTTHFISTRAYAENAAALADLRRLDAQSHGHHHHVHREPDANLRNLARADAILRGAGIEPRGFAAPHGRWNPGLDRTLETLGYRYSSDFSIGFDDLPFYPRRDGRFSDVLQVPVHPVCEGLFFDAGIADGSVVAAYYRDVVAAKLDRREPAFVYGHPERRLARHPEIVEAIADAVSGRPLTWRTTLSAYANWWRRRGRLRWSLVERRDGRYEILFDRPDHDCPVAVEIVRGRHVAHIPITSRRTVVDVGALAYERFDDAPAVQSPVRSRARLGLRAFLRETLDWETVTPVDELPIDSIRGRIKRELRRRRDRVA